MIRAPPRTFPMWSRVTLDTPQSPSPMLMVMENRCPVPPIALGEPIPEVPNRLKPPSQPPPLPEPAPDYTPAGGLKTASGELGFDETQYILRKCLRPEHRSDPNVIKFIASYLRCRDHRQAAFEAGIEPRSGYNLRMRPDIHEAIEQLSLKSVMKYGFDAADVVERVKEIASVDPGDLYKADGSYVENISELPPELRRAIKRMKVKNEYGEDPNGMRTVTGKIIEIEFNDKMKAIEMMGQEKQLFKKTTKVEHDIGGNMKSLLLGAQERAERVAIPAPTTDTNQEVVVEEE